MVITNDIDLPVASLHETGDNENARYLGYLGWMSRIR